MSESIRLNRLLVFMVLSSHFACEKNKTLSDEKSIDRDSYDWFCGEITYDSSLKIECLSSSAKKNSKIKVLRRIFSCRRLFLWKISFVKESLRLKRVSVWSLPKARGIYYVKRWRRAHLLCLILALGIDPPKAELWNKNWQR